MLTATRRAVVILILAGVVGWGLFGSAAALARPPHKKALADHLGPSLPQKLNDCRTCHLPDTPGRDPLDADKPHNAFGARLKAVRAELRKAGKKSDIPTRLDAVADEDSDGDGTSNLVELLAGRNPGQADDRPTAAEAAEGRKALATLRRSRSGYAWTPFEAVKRPPVPAVQNTAWVRNPIDALLAAEHEARGLTPRPEAPRAVLLRRVYLDLIGLPPTREELHAFLANASPDAYEKVVDGLLSRPEHGERWGRHWMDVWRYSDWAGWGAQVRDSQPNVWRWRDWIVESLNADKGYDQMLVEMLAADEASPEDADALRATGFLVRNFKLLSREKWMQDVVEHTFLAFQGVTVGCARCHDHMYDPILQREYYQLRAVFEPHKVRADRLPGRPDPAKDGLARAYDADPNVSTFLFLRGDDRTPDKTPLAAGVPEALGGTFAVKEVPLPPAAYAPDNRAFVIEENVAASAAAVARSRQALEPLRRQAAPAVLPVRLSALGTAVSLVAAQKSLDALAVAEAEAALAEARHAALVAVLAVEKLEEADKQNSDEWKQAATETTTAQRRQAVAEANRNLLAARQARLAAPEKMRAEADKKVTAAVQALAKAEADARQAPTTAYAKRNVTSYPKSSTGRRLALARWLTARDNPLTARVAVNHVWLRHFGQPIVPTVFDFGRNGRAPSHPALLDWLSAEFVESGWSMKHLHRLIVNSSAYRMASTPDDANLVRDRDNTYLWRVAPRRAEAEVVRDSVFAVAGRLDRTMGGPDIDHALGLSVPRRSLYFRHAAEKQMVFLSIFDMASVSECYQRKESVLPQQALALANSDMVLQSARRLTGRLAAEAGGDARAFAVAAFEHLLSRPPTEAELAECVAFLVEQARRYTEAGAATPDPALRARERLVAVLMNHHDFVTIR
jgi:hypothetical protein